MHLQTSSDMLDDFYRLGCSSVYGGGEFFEELIYLLYPHVISQDGCVLDCGVNLGQHARYMLPLLNDSGRYIGFEANPFLAYPFQKRLSLSSSAVSPQSTLYFVALSDHPSTYADFTVSPIHSGYSGLRKRTDVAACFFRDSFTIRVPQQTIDSFYSQFLRPVSLIKLDLEGAEFSALRGSSHTLRSDRPFVVFEDGGQSAADLYDYDQSELVDFFRSLSYSLFDLFGRPFSGWTSRTRPWYTLAVPTENFQLIHFLTHDYISLINSHYRRARRVESFYPHAYVRRAARKMRRFVRGGFDL